MAMPDPTFRFVCPPGALADAPESWASDMLGDGEIALVADEGGLAAIDAVTHALGLVSIRLLRGERAAAEQEATVIDYAGALPLVWVAGAFSDRATAWGRDRGPMTLLVAANGALPETERRRIDRFVATLGRQSE
jgi:hypothetical protein